MRSRIALLATLVVLGGLVLYAARPNAGPTAVLPTPTATATPSATESPTVAVSPMPSPPIEVNTIDLKVTVASVPGDFRYVVAGARVLLLDLGSRTAVEVASFSAPPREPGFPRADVVASEDGRSVLLIVYARQQYASAYLLVPEKGEANALIGGALVRAVLSRDGRRFAVGRNDSDPALTGLWVGTTSGGPMRRLVADDPQYAGSPPLPYAFSSSGTLLAFGLGNGESGAHAGIVSFSSTVGIADHSSGGWAIKGSDSILLGPSSGAEFISDDELFAWSSRGAFGGQTVAYTYRIAAKTTSELYRPAGDRQLQAAAWRPAGDQFATLEQPSCCGVGIPRTPWLRGRDGSAKKLIEPTPFMGDMWWSRGGTKLYATTGGDDSTGGVVELLTGQSVMGFCRRGGVAPGSCT